jgi:hypothetical protein
MYVLCLELYKEELEMQLRRHAGWLGLDYIQVNGETASSMMMVGTCIPPHTNIEKMPCILMKHVNPGHTLQKQPYDNSGPHYIMTCIHDSDMHSNA